MRLVSAVVRRFGGRRGRSSMRRALVPGYLVGGLILVVGLHGPAIEASPYVTLRTVGSRDETAAGPGSVLPEPVPSAGLPRIQFPGYSTEDSLRVAFDPGVSSTLDA